MRDKICVQYWASVFWRCEAWSSRLRKRWCRASFAMQSRTSAHAYTKHIFPHLWNKTQQQCLVFTLQQDQQQWKATSVKSFKLCLQTRQMNLAELLRLWGSLDSLSSLLPNIYVSTHAQNTLCISDVKLTGASLDTSYTAVPHSHLWGHFDDRFSLFSLQSGTTVTVNWKPTVFAMPAYTPTLQPHTPSWQNS